MSRKDYLIPAGLIALSLVPGIAGTARVVELAGNALVTPDNARFVAMPLPVLLHIPAAVVYSVLGALSSHQDFGNVHAAGIAQAGACCCRWVCSLHSAASG